MIIAGQTFTVTQAGLPTYTIAASASPSAGGTTSGGGTYASGSTVTVTATPNSCYTFVNWTEAGTVVSTSPSYSFTASGNRTLVANFNQINYTINTSSSPSGGGTTSGGGAKGCGSSVTVTATPASCYQFSNWTEGGVVVSTSASYTFTVSGNRTLVANFAVPNYSVGTSSSPSGGGTTGGGGTYSCGTPVTVTASPNSCYTFANWTEGGTVVSTSPSYSFTATGSRTLVANFNLISYTINTSSSPSGGGTTSGGGSKGCGSSVTVTATPAACYQFVNWTEAGTVVSTSSSYSFTASGNRTLVANFTPLTYSVSTSSSPSAGGSAGGGGIFNCGSSVTVSASANAGYRFVNWTDGGTVVSTSPSYTFTLSGNRALVANFTAVYTIAATSSPSAGGGTGGGGTYDSGASVTLTATPNPCYQFVNWTESGTVVSAAASYTFTATANRTLVANFSVITYTLTVTASPPAGGTVSGGGVKNCASSVTVSAFPASCYQFVNWTENGIPVDPASLTMNQNHTLVANFSQITYTINTSSSPSGGGTTSGGGTKGCGSSVTVIATPASCYQFVNWTEGGTVVSTSASYTFTAAGNRNLVANFTVPTYAISTSASPAAGGTTAGGGSKGCGTAATVSASANSGYSFINWTESGVEVSTSLSYTFTVAANRTLTANFACISSITPTGRSHGAGAETGTVSVSAGASCDWTATSNDSWLHITCSASGTGPGTVCYSVDSNLTNCIARTGTLTIVGHTFTVTQDAGTGSRSINPTSAGFGRNGGNGVVNVNAGIGCDWTATSGAVWVQITSGNSGTGAGTVGYSVDANPAGGVRSATLTVASQAFTVTQSNQAPAIVSSPIITNALLSVSGIAVVTVDQTNVFVVAAADADHDTLSYQWGFGDGPMGGWSSASSALHVYETNCTSYTASVNVSDGDLVTTGSVEVAVAWAMNATKVQARLNFAKARTDSCSIVASFDPCDGFTPVGKKVLLDVAGARDTYTLDGKGRGRGTYGTCRLAFNSKLGVWTVKVKLSKGSWRDQWSQHGLVNETHLKPGIGVTLPVVLLIGTDAFAAEPLLTYTSTTNKSGRATGP
jgi:hypothetical protein